MLAYFSTHYECGSLREMSDRFFGGESTHRPPLALTFDDGQLDNYEYALPVLKRAGVRATFFLPTASIDSQTPLWHDRLGFALQQALEMDHGARHLDALLSTHGVEVADACDPGMVAEATKALSNEERDDFVEALEALGGGPAVPRWSGMMNWAQAARLCELGHELGSHSVSHALLTRCTDRKQLDAELTRSRETIEANTGATVDSFCYPNGDHDAHVANATRSAGYQRAVTTEAGANGRDASPFLLERFDMDARRVIDANGRVSPALLSFRLSGLNPRV